MKALQYFLLIFLLVFISVSGLHGRHTLTDVYQKDYDLINRTVLVLNSKPNYIIEQQAGNRKIVITLEQTNRSSKLNTSFEFVSPVLESIKISDGGGGRLIVTISTKQSYHLEYFDLAGEEHKIVFDIYNKKTPATDWEKLVFSKFYFTVGASNKAEQLLLEITRSSPDITSAHFYLGRILQNRGQTQQAIEMLKQVRFNDPEYLQAQAELRKLGAVKVPYSHEMEQAFNEYREYFMQAQDLDRMYYLLSLVSASFGDEEKTKNFMQKINRRDTNVGKMRENLSTVTANLFSERELRGILPDIAMTEDGVPIRQETENTWIYILLAIIASALITYILTTSFSTKRKPLPTTEFDDDTPKSPTIEPAKKPIETEELDDETPVSGEEQSISTNSEYVQNREVEPKPDMASETNDTEPEKAESEESFLTENVAEPEQKDRLDPEAESEKEEKESEQDDDFEPDLETEEDDFEPKQGVRSTDEDDEIKASDKFYSFGEIEEMEIPNEDPIPELSVKGAENREETEEVTETEPSDKSIRPETIPCDDLKIKLAQRLYLDGWNKAAIAKELETPISEIEIIINNLNE
jgi:tetratricopeptide (TPR) repeat protein